MQRPCGLPVATYAVRRLFPSSERPTLSVSPQYRLAPARGGAPKRCCLPLGNLDEFVLVTRIIPAAAANDPKPYQLVATETANLKPLSVRGNLAD